MSVADAAIVSRARQEIARDLDDKLTALTGKKQAFTLFVWTEGRAGYVANADRAEVRAAVTKLFDHWDKGMPDIPAHEIS